MTQTKNFDAKNLNFVARIIIFLLSMLTIVGVKLPSDPTAIADQITNTVSTTGLFAVWGIVFVSVFMPIYNLVKTKPKITVATIFGNPNFWIYLATFILSILVLVGVHIPDGTGQALVESIYQRDWSALASIAIANIIDPLIRYFRDKHNTAISAG